MELLEAIKARHSVRSFTNQKIEGEVLDALRQCVEECNRESGLSMQLCLEEPRAFDSILARYGKFRNVRNYVALVGKKGRRLEECCGYYGEKVVLRAQQLGLNSCWVASTFSRSKSVARVKLGEKLLLVIALGYGEDQGAPPIRTKPIAALCHVDGEMPPWFEKGMQAARLAPTALNQQRFTFELDGNRVKATAGIGFNTKVDLGIAKYHFELGAGREGWEWA